MNCIIVRNALLLIYVETLLACPASCSLQITPACNLPLKSIRGGGKIVIVNLQVFFSLLHQIKLYTISIVMDVYSLVELDLLF